MPGFYHTFTTARSTEPDVATLLALLRGQDVTAGVQHQPGSAQFIVKKGTDWTAPQIAFVQNAIDTAASSSPQLTAQAEIDGWPIAVKALVLALIDQLNLLGSRVTPPVPAITPAAAIQAIRNKAGTL